MPHLPQVGGDDGTWGTILTDYLLVEHNPDGTQRALQNPVLNGTVDASTAAFKVKTFIPNLPTAVTPAGGTAVFDLTLNNRFTVSLSGNTSFIITGDSGGQPIMIRITSNGFSVTWWPGIKWSGGSPPTLTTGDKADWIYLQRTGNSTYDGAVGISNL